ncbi:DHHC zinc finger domain containing protein [Trichomonas vaginalis G3]|uniref:Palmitoyltransferase n=1 Tax=Trichomonas vaginalis (strain ATCC PRA-98 / G3) TaxID=412133 RepID=A2DWS1_TRIV3|nr:cysteine S-palmitoyltransferase protein [Trichomonas vaginalis G3]EAY15103.1 DHHC zinc finger domain containing protein [Trichomonas vaginalis G3]KAI5499205.1 cysteine S-palmitoyltransferase protein [Trichomonas vaginalis G3]|eukprot:XP_001327326.1 DHHC zinc finger domain containing protein [Trichomonas vaginalis G3]
MIVIFLTLCAAVFGSWSLFYTTSGAATIILVVVYLLIYFIWWIAYLNAMCRSPGYLPWFWFIEKRRKYTYEEQMAGIITTEEQKTFASNLDRPERAVFSAKARRIVLRADHICKWIGNWVGLKNYRYFFTQLVWFILEFICFFIIFILEIVDMAKNGWKTTVPRIAMLILIIPVILFFIFFMIVFVRHIGYLTTNKTTVQALKAERSGDYTNPYDLGCRQNCIQTIGDEKYCFAWFCPCPIPRNSDGFYWKRNDSAFVENQGEIVPPSNANAVDYEKNDDNNILLAPKDSEEAEYLSYSGEEESESSSLALMFSTQETGITTTEDTPRKAPPPPPPKPMAPVPPPISGEFFTNTTDYVPEPQSPKDVTRSSFIDTLTDKTVDGDEDEDFDDYTKGKKLPPLPVDIPQELSIRETDPESPHPADPKSRRYYESLRKPHFKHEPDFEKPLKHVHVKKVRIAVKDENGNPTGQHKIKKIKTFSDKEAKNEKSRTKGNIISTPGFSSPPSLPGSSLSSKEKKDFMFGFSMSSRDFGDDTFGDEYYIKNK